MEGLKKRRDFAAVYDRGRSRADAYLVLYADGPYCAVGDFDDRRSSRVGISVSKKVGNSVIRHRIKRRIREICRLKEGELPRGYDFVVIARGRAAEADYARLEKSVMKLMEKVIRQGVTTPQRSTEK